MSDFEKMVEKATGCVLRSEGLETFQVNVGLRCNQTCLHCHLDCSPDRTESMTWPIMELILEALNASCCKLVDITGGAPELNPHFRRFVEALYSAGRAVQVRTNLSVLLTPGMETMPEFYRDNGVNLVASLPCYLEENVRAQRGEKTYEHSIEAIRRLNEVGYGRNADQALNLVYNPGGPVLPPDQNALESEYRRELEKRFGIVFSNLLTITNMPIGRFLTGLRREGAEAAYLQLLVDSFNEQTIDNLMCRRQISIGWDGRMYDCDFNLALGYPVNHGVRNDIKDFDEKVLVNREIVTGMHCFGCTAGCGSSCGGVLV